MLTGHYVFRQVMDYLPLQVFGRCVKRYQGNRKVQEFSCLDQFQCMAFAQLKWRESLRDIEVSLRAQPDKLYHMGFRSRVARNTLANANAVRDWRMYADFAQRLIVTARQLYADEPLDIDWKDCRLCIGLDDHRSLPVVISMGTVPNSQSSHQAAYIARFARIHPVIHFYQ
jgi:hypothetical protein